MKYIVEFEDEPCMYEDEVHFYKCIQAPWWGLSERVIKQLTPYQPEPDCVSRKTALDAFGLSEKTRKYGGDHSGYDTRMLYEIQDTLENLPAVQPDHNADISEINKFIDGLEEIFAGIREQHIDDSVCGLCEYDGAYMGQSGDWCNECPGFDKDDCFKLSDETRKKWIEEIVNTYPDHTADVSKKVERTDETAQNVSDSDLVSRKAAIETLRAYFVDNFDYYIEDTKWIDEVLGTVPPVQPEQRWIPVKNRLPAVPQCRCLITRDDGRERATVEEALFSFSRWYDNEWLEDGRNRKFDISTSVIAWAPFPEPYRGGGKE